MKSLGHTSPVYARRGRVAWAGVVVFALIFYWPVFHYAHAAGSHCIHSASPHSAADNAPPGDESHSAGHQHGHDEHSAKEDSCCCEILCHCAPASQVHYCESIVRTAGYLWLWDSPAATKPVAESTLSLRRLSLTGILWVRAPPAFS